MRSLFLAVRAFFKILGSGAVADQVEQVLQGRLPAPATSQETAPSAISKPRAISSPPARSDALTLLATLQREARFVDLVMESLDSYSDAQVGATARSVLKDCRTVLDRLFALAPLETQAEGTTIDVPPNYDVGLLRLTGHLVANPPTRGRLVHPGWRAANCQVPTWSGSAASALVIMPAEVEVG